MNPSNRRLNPVSTSNEITRRDFMKKSALTVGAITLLGQGFGFANPASSCTRIKKWTGEKTEHAKFTGFKAKIKEEIDGQWNDTVNAGISWSKMAEMLKNHTGIPSVWDLIKN